MIKLNKKGLSPVGGFTLIELLVVIAIIGLLSTLAVVSLNNARSKARDARRTADLKTIQSALELYKGDSSNSLLFTVPDDALIGGAWASLGVGVGSLATYLPGGMPVDPGNADTQNYKLCLQAASPSNYILMATLENAGAGGSIGAVTSWADADCISSWNDEDLPTGSTCGSGSTVFCLGDISR